METEFTPWLSLGGGILIGIAATLFMALHGRIAGMTGILGGVIPPVAEDWALRAFFLLGAILGPLVFILMGGTIPFGVPVATPVLAIGGFIVGIGVYYGSGCTSGHGVCGMARFSPRSFVATVSFMVATFFTVYIVRHVVGL